MTQGAINQVDMLFIGHLGGTWDPMYAGLELSEAARAELATRIKDGQAAIGISMKLLWLYAGFLSSLAIGTQAMVARRYGEGNPTQAGTVALNSIAAAFVSSVAVTVIAIWILPTFFEVISKGAIGVIKQGIIYAEIRLLAIGVIVMTASIRSFFDGMARTYIFMWVALFMNSLNVILDYGLVFGAWGLPRMEVAKGSLGVRFVCIHRSRRVGRLAFSERLPWLPNLSVAPTSPEDDVASDHL